ncbi:MULTISPECIES: helix-turn-helix domain-containing protein [Shouchella]|uniref:HTH cro/C1-type domain-containing protein n=1 Tax=Alkalicoccobacillus plakortidis TaxID=444060 RepID=A0A9D5DL56_9BACI|nr:hypothetical protein AN965_16870 [Alkalicoccobacillus plakortidis]
MARFNLEEMMSKAEIKSISELSSISGVSRPTLHSWKLNQVSRINIPVAEKVCEALNCEMAELISLD